MAQIRLKVHGGDFPKSASIWVVAGHASISGGLLGGGGKTELNSKTVAELSVATEEAVKRIGGTVGWGAVGGVLLGPVGLLAGLLAGGRGKETTFVMLLKDGRKLLATTDTKSYARLLGAVT